MIASVTLPILVVSEANRRDHWTKAAARARVQRHIAAAVVRARRVSTLEPLVVTLTRLAPRRLDSDNLARAFKAIRDGIADGLGIDDGDDRVEWRYAQGPGMWNYQGGPSLYGIRIEIAKRGEVTDTKNAGVNGDVKL